MNSYVIGSNRITNVSVLPILAAILQKNRKMKYFIFILILTLNSCYGQKNTKVKQEFETSFRTLGKGFPILIINGGPGMNSEGFVDIAKKISELGYQTIIYDQRGTGKSKLENYDSTTITMDLMVEDIENLRKKLKIKKWIVLGHSFGGLLATHYVAKYPEYIEKIIFSSSGGVNLKFLNYVSQRINFNLTKSDQDSLAFYQNSTLPENERINKRAKFLAKAYVFDKSKAPIIAERLTQINFNINSLVFQNLQKIKFDYTNKFLDCKIPVLVVQGKNDIISIETAQEIANTFGNSKLVLIDNCGHYGWLDNEKFYIETLKSFLNDKSISKK